MDLYLIRHAIAVPHGTPGIAEEERPLTPEGIRKMRRCIKAMSRLGIRFDEVWTSPLLRARQTADLLVECMELNRSVRQVPFLLPEGDFEALAMVLADTPKRRSVALIGHEPSMGELATWLITGQKMPAIRFKKGSVACIECDQFTPPAGNQLVWMLNPKQMASLALS